MDYKLYAYSVGTQSVGADLDSWSDTDLNGNDAFIVSTQSISGYNDINTIENWDKFGDIVSTDYQEQQRAVRLLGYEIGWETMSHTEKDIIIDYYAHPDINGGSTSSTQRITHLMTEHSMSFLDAKYYLVDMWHCHWVKTLETSKDRWLRAVKVVVKYLNFEDSSDLFDTVESLVTIYLDTGRLGKDYGSSKDGLLDYIMSTNAYEGIGLEYNSYTLTEGTWDGFKNELYDVFMDAKYWDEIKTYI